MTVKLTASLANKELRELCKLHLATQKQAVCNQIDILRITSIFQDGCIRLHRKNVSPEPLQQFLIMYSPLLKELIIAALLVICYQFYCKNSSIINHESRRNALLNLTDTKNRKVITSNFFGCPFSNFSGCSRFL
jgi:hypothetical protein